MVKNPQLSNVGNLGDIIKHAALVELAKLIQSRNQDEKINYLDTHTYLLESTCSNGGWRKETAELLSSYARYGNYIALESATVDSGQYLCSSGLALAVLKEPALFLAEADDDTRKELSSQLAASGIKPQIFFADMKGYSFLQPIEKQGPTLAIVDPFKLNDTQWREIWDDAKNGITAIHKDGSDGIVLVFNYDTEKPATWFEPPQGFEGPVMSHASGKYHFAAYCTPAIRDSVLNTLDRLGWHLL